MDETRFTMKIEIAGKEHTYECESGVMSNHIKEALFQFLWHMGNLERDAKAKETENIISEESSIEVKEEEPATT